MSTTWKIGLLFVSCFAMLCLAVIRFAGNSGSPANALNPVHKGSELPPQDEFTRYVRGKLTLTVAPGVHVLDLSPSVAFAIETPQGIVMIDTGVDETATKVREKMLSLSLRPEDINTILLTHAHYDHVLGANKLRQVSGATVCAGEADCPTLRSGDADAMFSLFPRESYSGDPIDIDRELKGGEVMDFGDDISIEVIATPGHTHGSTCYLLNKNGQRILFTGDVIASMNFGPATYSTYVSPEYRGDAPSYLATINHLLAMDTPDLLLVGHPAQQQSLHSINMTRSEWSRLIEPAKTELEELIANHSKDGRDFLDSTPKEIEPGLHYFGMVNGIGVYWMQLAEKHYLINAPGGDKFTSFLADKQRALGLSVRSPDIVLLTSTRKSTWSGLMSLDSSTSVIASETIVPELRKVGQFQVSVGGNDNEIVHKSIDSIAFGDELAYSVAINNKRVLITPSMPRQMSLRWSDRAINSVEITLMAEPSRQLVEQFQQDADYRSAYLSVVEQLQANESPDLWLPEQPTGGQNANLYDGDWQRILEYNRKLAAGERF